jgi:hypothetical protein
MKFKKQNKRWYIIFIPILILSSVTLFATFKKISQINKLKTISERHQPIRPIKKTPFSDEVLVQSAVYNFKQSIKHQDRSLFERTISEQIEDSTGLFHNKHAAKQKFDEIIKNHDMSLRSEYSKRRTPKLKNVKPTWDFEIDITKIKIYQNDNKADIDCEIYFVMDQPDDDIINKKYSKKSKRVKEKIELSKENGKWRIKKVNKLFKFLSDRNNKLEELKNKKVN